MQYLFTIEEDTRIISRGGVPFRIPLLKGIRLFVSDKWKGSRQYGKVKMETVAFGAFVRLYGRDDGSVRVRGGGSG